MRGCPPVVCVQGAGFFKSVSSQADDLNAVGVQEAAFYSAKHTSFEESHDVFRRAMPGGFAWEVTEVYSG